MKMNFRQIRYFCEIVDAGSAALAAERLFVAPTAISMQLSLLESHLGGELFDRTRRPMELTALGKFFYPRAKALLVQTLRLEEETHGLAEGRRGWLGIGFVRSTIFSILPTTIRAFREHYPDVKLNLIELLSDYQPEQLRKGTIHLGISRFIGNYDRPADLQHALLLDDPFVAVLPADHPLAGRESLSVKELDRNAFIIYPKDPSSVFGQQMLGCLRHAGANVTIAHEAIEIHTALALVAAGLGWSLVGRSARDDNRKDICFVSVTDIQETTSIVAAMRQGEDDRLAAAFLKILLGTSASLNLD